MTKTPDDIVLVPDPDEDAGGLLQHEVEFLRGFKSHVESIDCTEFGCCIHNPTNHRMRSFQMNWRFDRGLMERVCSHGVGHPDPDHMNWYFRTYGAKKARIESVHGCDGCCIPHE